MTMTSPDLDTTVRSALEAAGAAAVGALLVEPMLRLGAIDALPPLGPGAQAVVVDVAAPSGSGELALVASAELCAAVQEGPLGHQSLESAVEPVLAAAATALEAMLAGPLRVQALRIVDPSAVAGGPAIALLAGDEPAAALALRWAESAREEPLDLPTLDPSSPGGQVAGAPLELLHDVEMAVTAELGRTRLTVRNLLALVPGAIVELDRAAGAPIDLLVNGTLIARGEVVVLDDEYGIRLTEIVRRDRSAR